MKVCISEDHSNSREARFIKVVYGEDNSVFSRSNGRLENSIENVLLNVSCDDEVIVYIDLVPGNADTYSIFFNLFIKYCKIENLYIVPVLCSEACLLMSIEEMGYSLSKEHKGILNGAIGYKKTKYSDKNTLEKAVKQFYKDIPLLQNRDKYCKDISLSIGNIDRSLEERSAYFVVSHGAYLNNDILSRYILGKRVKLRDYMKSYINLYNRVADANGFIKISDSKLETILRYCGNK